MIFQTLYYGEPMYDPVLTFLPAIIGLILNIGLAVVIAKDAQKRGMEPTIYVVLTCCCGCLIGGVVYLISASNNPVQTGDLQQPSFNSNQGQMYGQQPQLMHGQQQQQRPPQPRPNASTTMPSVGSIFCPICGSQNQKGAKFCSTCGADLH